ncbi:MAG: glycosyltransferase [Alphaproteobacteria bacterium]|nr:glycosyltransferase [Alphaproteobacteria bacterium]
MRIMLCHPTGFEWGPPMAARGIPGTEEAIIYLSRALAAQGADVAVVTRCGPHAGRHDGVEWIDSAEWQGDSPDVAVITDPADERLFGPGTRLYLWLHVDLVESAILPRLERLRRIMPLSRFSRGRYPSVPDDKVFVTRNGIIPEQFDQTVERHPFTIAYGSDYDRGLLAVLELWREIRRHLPEARLRVFYGWQVYDEKIATMRRNGDPNLADWEAQKRRIEELMGQDGVTHLGRLGHDAVAREFLHAAVWAYPCQFPETSCITAMKAQAGGAVPVIIPVAALAETVLLGLRTTRVPATIRHIDAETLREWGGLLVGILKDQPQLDRVRPVMMALARERFDWRGVAREWHDQFRASLEEG